MSVRRVRHSIFKALPSRGKKKSAGAKPFGRQMRIEALEDRQVMAADGPELVSIQPNGGQGLEAGDVLHTAPRELTLRFDEGQAIDPASLGAIEIGLIDPATGIARNLTPGF